VESSRVEAAIRLAAAKFGLQSLHLDTEYHDPGPMDVSILCQEDNQLMLKPNVVVVDGSTDGDEDPLHDPFNPPDELKKVKSLPLEYEAEQQNPQDGNDMEELDRKGDNILCCAVPSRFFEMLRKTHGVVCVDGFDISFQAYAQYSSSFLHYESKETEPATKTEAGVDNRFKPSRSRPLEFRRRVIAATKKVGPRKGRPDDGKSPMTKLMQEERRLNQRVSQFAVEVHPVQIACKVYNKDGSQIVREAMALVSERSNVESVLQDLLSEAAPETSSNCKRMWCKRNSGTKNSGDGFELINISNLDGKLTHKLLPKGTSQLAVRSWLDTLRDNVEDGSEIVLLVETRKTGEEWPRKSLELATRLEVGDWVDAQDETGKWFESIVKEISDNAVKVHYLGWASKWDSWIQRHARNEVPAGVNGKLNPPEPIWSKSTKWRQQLDEGATVEVRDTSSRAARPKWYKGKVRVLGLEGAALKSGELCAELEKYDEDGKKSEKATAKPLLIMGVQRQVLVFVEEEQNGPGVASAVGLSDDTSIEQKHPSLRWISLFSEEICKLGTHTKIDVVEDTAVATLRYEYEAGRKPVEIMKSVNNMYGSGFMKESLRGNPPAPGSVGLHNLGNSCFLNSIVQCLNHIEPLTKYFLEGKYLNDLNRKNPLGSGGHVATAYSNLLHEMWGGKYSALAPRLLKQTVASFAPQFNNYYQHDSQEFCQFLMDGLHEDCNRVKTKPYVEELEGFGRDDQKVAIETWRKHLLRHDSIVVDHCQGMHRSHLTCPLCGHESIKFDVFSTISVPISKDKENSDIQLEDCIGKFMEGEQLDEVNAWYCPKCKKHVCALKMIALWSVPDILILHLKRFMFEHDQATDRVIRSKIDHTVNFPINNLDMSKFVLGPIDEDAPPTYRVSLIVCLFGPRPAWKKSLVAGTL